MALAGARKAKALAWNRGNLNTRKAPFGNDVTGLSNAIYVITHFVECEPPGILLDNLRSLNTG